MSKHLKRHLLNTIAPCLCGIWMNLDQQSVCAHCDCAFAECFYQVRAAGSLARINNDRTMRLVFNDWDCSQIEGVASVGFERADTPFAEHQIGVLVCQYV